MPSGAKEKRYAKYPGVFSYQGKRGVTFGIDYVHPATGRRVRKTVCGESARSR